MAFFIYNLLQTTHLSKSRSAEAILGLSAILTSLTPLVGKAVCHFAAGFALVGGAVRLSQTLETTEENG